MSLNKFQSTVNSLDLEAGLAKLNVETEVKLRGSTFPSSTSTAGYVLSNSDGAGALAWASSATLSGVSNGSWAPTFTPSAGTVSNQNPVVYIKIGDRISFGGRVEMTLPASGTSFNLDFNAPSGFTFTSSTEIAVTATGGSSGGTTVLAWSSAVDTGSCRLAIAKGDGGAFASESAINITFSGVASLTAV